MPGFGQPQMRRFGDHEATRNAIYDGALSAVQSIPPVENTRYSLSIRDPGWSGPGEFSLADHKNALLTGRSLARRLTGTFALTDKSTGNVVDSRRMTVASVPALTKQGTFIIDGHSSVLANQFRLLPGIYSRRKANGETESHANFTPGKGVPHRINLDPETGVFKINVGQAEIPAAALMRAMGVTKDEMEARWGKELAAVNLKAEKPHHLDKLYERMGPPGPAPENRDELSRTLAQRVSSFELDPWVSKRTLGAPHSRYDKAALLTATGKLLDIAKGKAEPDDRDNPHFSMVWGPEHLLSERLERSKPLLAKMLWQATNAGSLKRVQPGPLSPAVRYVFTKTGLGLLPEGSNAAEFMDHGARITKVGEGGIGKSSESVPMSARGVSPGQFPFIDPSRTSESESVGVDLRVAFGTKLGADRRIYAPVLDAKSGKLVYRSPQDMADKVVAFPNATLEPHAVIPVIKGGKLTYAPREQVDYHVPTMEQSFSPMTNMVPMKSAAKAHRSSMGSRFITQSLPLIGAEPPWVRSQVPGQPGKSFEELYGKHMGAVFADAKKPGVVESVTPDAITVRYADGTKQAHELYNNTPSGRKTSYHNEALIKPGDQVAPGQILAKSNYTDHQGTAAYGLNARVAFMAHPQVYEDSMLLSRSFADRMKSDHLYKHELAQDEHTTVGKKAHTASFPGKYPLETLKAFGDDGVVKPGTVVNKDDPLILGVRKRPGDFGRLSRSGKTGFTDASETWHYDEPGVVTDAVQGPDGPVVTVKTQKVLQSGDKVAGRFGNKGIAVVIPDHEMPHDSEGKPIDLVTSSLGTVSRANPAAILEAALGKIVRKTGKPYVYDDFQHGRSAAGFVQQELAKHGISFKEDLTDPKTGRTIPNVAVGDGYFLKLNHLAESKSKGRGLGGVDESGQPTRGQNNGAMRMSLGDTNALLSASATSVIHDAHAYRGQANPDFWLSYMSGFPTPKPTTSPAFDRFLTELRAAGVDPVRKDSRYHMMALTNQRVKELAGDREIKNGETLDFSKGGSPYTGGLFSPDIFGTTNSNSSWAHIPLHEPLLNPVMEEPARRLLNLTESQFRDVISGKHSIPTGTGPKAISDALGKIDVKKELQKTQELTNSTRKGVRDDANRKLVYLKGLEKTGQSPKDWILDSAPVLPPGYRPVTNGPGGVIVSDANVLYKELFEANDALKKLSKETTDTGAEKLNLYDGLKAVMGLGEPIGTKNRERGVKGILAKLLGDTSKRCYDEKTEILTHRGWIRFEDLTTDDTVATCNPSNGAFEWQRPSAVHKYAHNGPMIKLGTGRVTELRKSHTAHVNLLVTPNHRHWLRPNCNPKVGTSVSTGWRIMEASEIPKCSAYYQSAATSWASDSRELPDCVPSTCDPLVFAEFLGWWVAEGWIHSGGYAVQIGQRETFNPEACARLADLIPRLGYGVSVLRRVVKSKRKNAAPDATETDIWWYLKKSRALADWLKTNVGNQSHVKKLPRLVLDWSSAMLTAFVSGYLGGDGSKRMGAFKPGGTGLTTNKNRNNLVDNYTSFCTSSPDLFDDLQELFCKLGVTVRLRAPVKSTTSRYQALYGSLVGRWFVTASNNIPSKTVEHYEGNVYCCTVPNGLLFVRREGTVCVSGNSYIQQKLLGSPTNLSGRAQALPNPDLDMDEVGIPESVAWNVYHPFVMRRMVRQGVPRAEAARLVADKHKMAQQALLSEMADRPVLITRYPALHRHSVIAANPRLVAGSGFHTNNLMIKTMGGDHDGNCVDFYEKLDLLLSKSALNANQEGVALYTQLKEAAMRLPQDEQVSISRADGEVVRIRIGDFPRLGDPKSGTANQKIYTVPDGVSVLTYDHVTSTVSFQPVTSVTYETDHQVVKVTTETGREVIVSDNESMCVFDTETAGVKKAAPKVGDYVPCVRREPILGTEFSRDLGWWYGMLISDGWVTDRTVGLSKMDESKRKKFIAVARAEIHENFAAYTYDRNQACRDSLGAAAKIHLNGADLAKVVFNCYAGTPGDGERGALYKKIPEEILERGSRECLLGLMAGLLDGDGVVTWNKALKNKRFVARVSTSSPYLVASMKILCRKLGMRFSVTETVARGLSKHTAYTFSPSVNDFYTIAREIQLVGIDAVAVIDEFAKRPAPVLDHGAQIPVDDAFIKDVRGLFSVGRKSPTRKLYLLCVDVLRRHWIGRGQVRTLLAGIPPEYDHPHLEPMRRMAECTDVGWEKITSVEVLDRRDVFDLCVPSTKVFAVGSGIVVWDTYSINVPLSDEAVKEAREKLFPSKNLFSPATMKATTYLPNAEYVAHTHAASTMDEGNKPVEFKTLADARRAHALGLIGMGTRIRLTGEGKS